MHSLWIFFIKKRAFTYMLMFSLVTVGMYSLVAIPKESSPEVIIPVGIVSTVLRGGSAEDTEALITDKLEEEIGNLENIDTITSSSREGISIVTVQFIASADIEKSIQDLKDAVDKAKVEFPEDATEPSVTKVNFSDQPILIVSISSDGSPSSLTSLGETLERELKKISGVSKVIVEGTRQREVQVVVEKNKLLQYNLSVNQVITALSTSNVTLPIGTITVRDIDYPVKFSGKLLDANDLADVSVASNQGVPVYLRDIAFIADGLEAPRTYSRVSVNGEPSEQALTVNIYKKAGGDVTAIASNIKEELDKLKETTLAGASVVISFDRGELVEKDLKELTRVGLETVILVMLMLFLTIGWRESLVAGLSIPLSFVIAFIGLYASGNSINFVSLFSLILAIGILVDSGIVVAEAIHTRRKLYGDAEKAAIASIKEYAWPLIAGTMTTVAVFVPLFFISGTTGKFIASIPFTIIFVLLASIVVALGMVPLLAIALTKDTKSRFEELQDMWSERAKLWYKNILGTMLTRRDFQNIFFTLLGVGFIVSLALPVAGLVKVQFFPQDDQDFIFVSVEKPQGTPLAQTDFSVREVEEILYESEHIESFVSTVGASSAFSNNGSTGNSKLSNITVLLKKDRELTSTEIIEILRKDLQAVTSATIIVDQGNNGPPTGAPVVISFLGDNLDELTIASDKAEALLKTIEGTQDVQSSLRDDGILFDITINRAKASLVGLSPASVAQILRTSVAGTIATTIKQQSDDIDVVVKINLNENFINPEDTIKTNIDAIKQLPVVTPTGTILLGSLVDVTLSGSKAVIAHDDKERVARVTSALRPSFTAVEVVNAFKARESELNLPETVTIDYGGENEEVNRSFRDMFLALIAGMVGMLAILVLEFNSVRFALYLLFAVPLSLIGVLGGLALTGQTLSFSSMLGFIALAGVIINHGIILLDSILQRLEKEKEHSKITKESLYNTIIEASSIRLRPIFLTTVTTVIGMVPLAGASALWGPLAFAIMFGLSFAMLLTLILVPVLLYRYPGDYKEATK